MVIETKHEVRNFLVSLIKKYKKKEIYGAIFAILYSLIVFTLPYVARYLVDNVSEMRSVKDMQQCVLIFFIISILQPVVAYIRDNIFKYVSESLTFDIKGGLFKKVLYSPYCFFEKFSNGEIISRIVNDGGRLSDFLTNLWTIAIGDVIFLAIGLTGLVLLSPTIAPLIILLIILYAVYNFYVSKIFERMSERMLVLNDNICTTIEQNVNNIELIKSFSVEEKMDKQYLQTLGSIQRLNNRSWRFVSLYNGISEAIVAIVISGIYYQGFSLVINNRMTIGTIVALVSYFQMLISPVHDLIDNNIEFRKIIPAVKRIIEYLKLPEENNMISFTKKISEISPLVSFNNVSFSYVEGIKVFSNVNFLFEGPGLYCLIGQSGVGKSTIAKLVLGLYTPHFGEIRVCIDDKLTLSLKELRSNISYVAQNTELFNISIRENLTLGCNSIVSDEDLIKICSRLKLNGKITELPDGYDTIVNEKLNFSGGEIQRIAIARAFLKDSPINIFDESTSSLDEGNLKEVIKLIEEIKKTKMVILITHKAEMLKGAKKIINLNERE